MRIFWPTMMLISGYLYTQTNLFQTVNTCFYECSSERDVLFSPYSSEQASAFLQQRHPKAHIVSIEKDLIPYLKMHVKCLTKGGSTREHTLLWSLYDGEIVIEAKKWSKTKGIGGCIRADIEEEELPLLRTIMENNGQISLKQLANNEKNLLPIDNAIENFLKKNLIVLKRQNVFFRAEKIKLLKDPYTSYPEFISCLSKSTQRCLQPKISSNQIIKFAEAFFKKEMLIVVKHKIVLLPVYIVAHSINERPRILYYNGVTGLEYAWSE